MTAGFAERRELRKGETLFDAGDGVDEHLFVLSGQLQATTQRSDGVVNLLAVVGVGAVFGEFPDVQPCRTATVTAASDDCVVLAVHLYDLARVLAEAPRVSFEDSLARAPSRAT